MVVRNSLCSPNSTGLTLARTIDFKVPNLILVGNCKALAPVAISILLGNTAHDFNCLTCCGAILKTYSLKLLNPEDSLAVNELLAAIECGLTYCHLLLVHARIRSIEESVGISLRRNNGALNLHNSRIPWLLLAECIIIYILLLARFKMLAWLHCNICPVVRVTSVCRHYRAIC